MLDSFLANVGDYVHTNPWLALVAVFVGGVLTASNPCVLAMIPLMMGFVAGRKEDKPGGLRAFLFSLVFILGLPVRSAARRGAAVAGRHRDRSASIRALEIAAREEAGRARTRGRRWPRAKREAMKVKILGTGCAKCKKLYAEAEKAVASSGVAAEIEKVEKIDDIMKYGVMMTPALVIDEEVKASGRIAPASEIVTWITTAAAKAKP
jgi:small redox-active disulfide protein 2